MSPSESTGTEPTKVTPAPPALPTSKLDHILGYLEGAAAVTAAYGAAAGPQGAAIAGIATLADYFLKIAQASVAAHEAVTGKPLDMSTLHQIDLVP